MQTKHEHKPLVSMLALAPAEATIKTAISGEDKAHDAWKKGAKALYACGLRYSMIGGATQHADTRKEVSDWIEKMLPEKMHKLLSPKGRDVAEMPDTDKALRRIYKQRVGVYLSRIGNYLKQHEGIVPERKPRATQAAAPVIEHNMGSYIMLMRDMMANRTKVNMTAKDAEEFGAALETALVIVTRAKAAADKLAGK